jgi:Kef-type K+ transport system membrane component KefB
MDSIILYEPGLAYYYKSEAALKIGSQLGFSFFLFSVFLKLYLKGRKPFYDYIVKTGTAGLEKRPMHDSN